MTTVKEENCKLREKVGKQKDYCKNHTGLLQMMLIYSIVDVDRTKRVDSSG